MPGHGVAMPDPLQGPPLALPRPLDRAAERWARLPPRVRTVAVIGLVVLLGGLQAARLSAAQARWGGPGVVAWQATATSPAGGRPAVERVRLPSAVLPPGAVTERPGMGAVLSLPLVEGAILTEVHLSPAGPVAGLPPDERLLPVPVDRDWGIEAGSSVDVWAVLDGRGATEPLATARPVVVLRDEGPRPIALVSLHADDVAEAAQVLARGRLLLALRS